MCLGLEVHFRGFLGAGLGFEFGASLKAEQAGEHVAGEAAYAEVVRLYRFVEEAAALVDAVFRTFELGLQFEKFSFARSCG